MKQKTAFVICINDYPRHVVLDDMEKALQKMDELAKDHYKLSNGNMECRDYKEYKSKVHWNLEAVKYE